MLGLDNYRKSSDGIEQVTESLERAELQLVVELWFAESSYSVDPLTSIQCVSARCLNLHFSPTRCVMHLDLL